MALKNISLIIVDQMQCGGATGAHTNLRMITRHAAYGLEIIVCEIIQDKSI